MNEFLLVLTALFSTVLVFVAAQVDRTRLYGVIVIFLILISVGGSKIVEFFGFETNTGNVFYAALCLAVYFLAEEFGRKEALRAIRIGVIAIAFFTILLQLVVALDGSGTTYSVDQVFTEAFGPAARLALASLLGFVVSQVVNVNVYAYLKRRAARLGILFRANVSNILAQVIDSAVFFSVAFMGVVAPANITEVMIMGFAVKVAYVLITSPLLLLGKVEEDTHRAYRS